MGMILCHVSRHDQSMVQDILSRRRVELRAKDMSSYFPVLNKITVIHLDHSEGKDNAFRPKHRRLFLVIQEILSL